MCQSRVCWKPAWPKMQRQACVAKCRRPPRSQCLFLAEDFSIIKITPNSYSTGQRSSKTCLVRRQSYTVHAVHYPSCGHASAVFLASTKPGTRQCCCCLFATHRAQSGSLAKHPPTTSQSQDWRHTIDKPAATRPSGSGNCDAINMPMLPNRVMSDVHRSTSRH
jgi:hypothetical protein